MKAPEQPLVTIGLTTYNRPVLLRRALENLTAQDYQNLEIVVSDNGSPGEEVPELVRGFAQRDPRVKYHRHPVNRGMAFNWNYVIGQARGKYFMHASDDDLHDPQFVSELVSLMEADPSAAVAFCEHRAVDPDGAPQAGYGPHYAALQALATPVKWLRQVRFFLQDERSGKSNLVYGLVRTSFLDGFTWAKFHALYSEQGCDVLFGFRMLCRGPLAVSPRTLFSSCVGNVKTYSSGAADGFWRRNLRHLCLMGRYSLQYPKIAAGWMRFILLALWPVKMLLVAYAMVSYKAGSLFRKAF